MYRYTKNSNKGKGRMMIKFLKEVKHSFKTGEPIKLIWYTLATLNFVCICIFIIILIFDILNTIGVI